MRPPTRNRWSRERIQNGSTSALLVGLDVVAAGTGPDGPHPVRLRIDRDGVDSLMAGVDRADEMRRGPALDLHGPQLAAAGAREDVRARVERALIDAGRHRRLAYLLPVRRVDGEDAVLAAG